MPDGRIWEVECFPARGESGQGAGTVYIARDVSEEETLRRRTLLVQKMESIGVMAGGIAHEFNNILAIIIGYTELCLEATTPGEKLYGHLKEIFKASGRARDVVRQMLTFSRGDDTPKSPLQVIPLVKETVRFLRASLTEAITFELDLPHDAPLLNANPTQIQQALLNLCKNAADAMPGGGTISIKLSSQELPAWPEDPAGVPLGPFVVISVRDNGVGISPEHLENIFDPFFSTKPAGVGTGLGLSVVHGIVTGMGGHILVESKEGGGAAFTLYLPAHPHAPEPLQDRRSAPSAGQAHKGRRILHVDDSELILHLARLTLNRLGYETVSCPDPAQALALFLADPHAFDLAILDQAMPGMPGMELLRKMKAARPDMLFLLCTGYSETCLQHQTDQSLPHVLMKPFKKGDLAKAVQEALDAKVA